MNKFTIRRKIIKLRKKKYNQDLNINPKKFFLFLKKNRFTYKNFGGYYPSNNEIDDLEILHLLEKKNYQISLPIIRKNNQMDFFQWSRKIPFKINQYGIPEPLSKKKNVIQIFYLYPW